MTKTVLAFVVLSLFAPALIGQAASAKTKPRPATLVRLALPAPLRQVVPGKTKRSEVHKLLGQPGKALGNTREYFEVSGLKYDTTVSYDGQTVAKVVHYFPERAARFSEVRPLLSRHQLEQIDRDLGRAPASQGHRYFTVRFADDGIVARYLDMSEPRLAVVELVGRGR